VARGVAKGGPCTSARLLPSLPLLLLLLLYLNLEVVVPMAVAMVAMMLQLVGVERKGSVP
jgi:hypothetical protein